MMAKKANRAGSQRPGRPAPPEREGRALAPPALPAASVVLLMLAAPAVAAGPDAAAADAAAAVDTTGEKEPLRVREWPFPETERFRYSVRLGRLRLGEGEIAARPDSAAETGGLRRVSLLVDVGAAFVRVRNRQLSWLATDPLRTLRVRKHYDEPGGEREARWTLDHEAGVARRPGGEPVTALPDAALDGIGLLYLLRTMELAPGDTIRLDRHFQPDGNPVRFRVVDRERIRVPAGRFRTLVVEPVIPALGVFNEDRAARVWLTDDERRLIVRVQSSTKLGPLRMHLEEYASGGE